MMPLGPQTYPGPGGVQRGDGELPPSIVPGPGGVEHRPREGSGVRGRGVPAGQHQLAGDGQHRRPVRISPARPGSTSRSPCGPRMVPARVMPRRTVNDVARFDGGAASGSRPRRRRLPASAKAIEPGKYTVIMEPPAAVDLLQPLVVQPRRPAGRRRAEPALQGRRRHPLGEKLVDESVSCAPTLRRRDSGIAMERRRPAVRGAAWIERGMVARCFWLPLLGAEDRHEHSRRRLRATSSGGRKRHAGGADPGHRARGAGDAPLVHPVRRSADAAAHRTHP